MFRQIVVWVVVFVAMTAVCYGQEAGSAESHRKLSGYLQDIRQSQQEAAERDAEHRKLAKEMETRVQAWLETGRKLFGSHKHWAEMMKYTSTDQNGATHNPFVKVPTDYQIGNWGFIDAPLKTISRVSSTEYLVMCEGEGKKVLLLRGFDMSKVTDDVEFVLCQPVAIKTTYSYETVSGAKNTVLVAESSDEEFERAFAKVQEEAANRLAVAESERVEREKQLQAKKDQLQAMRDQLRNESTRIWTDATTGQTMKAQFVYRIAEKVKLRKEDGSVVLVPMEQLSDEDQAWITNWLKGKHEILRKEQPAVTEPKKEQLASATTNLPAPTKATVSPQTVLVAPTTIANEPIPATRTETFAIISARWGVGSQWSDVTSKVAVLVRDGRLSVMVPLEPGGLGFPDSAPNQVKYLDVTYRCDGRTQTARVRAGSQMELPSDADELPKNDSGTETLLGRWAVSVGAYHATWTFLKSGVVLSTAGTKQGTWKLEKTAVHIAWEAQAWESFNRPLDSAHTTGDSWQGKGIVVARKLTD